jgi:hypothetical protein
MEQERPMRVCTRLRWRMVLGVFLAAVGFSTTLEAVETGRSETRRCEVRWERNLLSLQVDNTTVREAAAEIARVTGIKAWCQGPCGETVSASMTGVTLERALRSLLSSFSYCLVYEGPGGVLPTQLLVFTGKSGEVLLRVPRDRGNGTGSPEFSTPAAVRDEPLTMGPGEQADEHFNIAIPAEVSEINENEGGAQEGPPQYEGPGSVAAVGKL